MSVQVHHPSKTNPSREVILENKAIVVERAHIIGFQRTKADFIQDALKPLLKCRSFLEAYKVSLECRDQLMAKGIFKTIDVYLDTTEAYDKKVKNGIQVIYKVQERNFINGEARTEISSQDRPRWVLRAFSPNVFGRGEAISASLSHTFSGSGVAQAYLPTEFTTTCTKPFRNGSNLMLSLLKENIENPWSCCKEITRGLQLGYNFPFKGNKHTVEWLGHWRELCCISGSQSTLEISKQYGHSLKSSLKHTVVIDNNDLPVLPKEGRYYRMSEELAGFGGDIKFFKHVIESTSHTTFRDKFTFGLGCQAGLLIPLGPQVNKVFINDKFFIGGPLTLRGFKMNRVGNGSAGTFLGSNCFWMLGGHIYAPLPFYWDKFGCGTWVDNFRIHSFVNAGNAFDPVPKTSELIFAMFNKTRVSCGCGLVYKFLNSARMEINLCLPLLAQQTDITSRGLQFGIGVSSV